MTELLDSYKKAASLSGPSFAALLRNRYVLPTWTGDRDCFWYSRVNEQGLETKILVDPDAKSVTPLDAQEEVQAASDDAGQRRSVVKDGVEKLLLKEEFGCGLFMHEHNLWLWDPVCNESRALTSNGEEAFAWGVLIDNNMMHIPVKVSPRPRAPAYSGFSPSGEFVLTARVDEREMPHWPFVELLPKGRSLPKTHPIRVRQDDDPVRIQMELAIINVASGETTALQFPAGNLFGLMSHGTQAVWWSSDERELYLVEHGAGSSQARLLCIDVETGMISVKVSEQAQRLYESNTHVYKPPLIQVLPESRQVLWFSQRDGWGHLYLYDLDTGELLRRVTHSQIVVSDVLHVDSAKREILFIATGAFVENPNWRAVFRASLDREEQQLLTPEALDHDVMAPSLELFSRIFPDHSVEMSAVSPSGRFFVDHMSTVEIAPRIVLRSTDAVTSGAIRMELETTDVSAALQVGYRPPCRFITHASDAETAIHGVLFLPETDVPEANVPDGSYPMVDMMYAGYQVTRVPVAYLGSKDMTSVAACDGLALATLGIAAFVVDGRGTPGRDRKFRQWTHGEGDIKRGLEDHIACIQQLPQQFPALDSNRVGVVGHSYGGYNSVRAMLLFPEVFSACVSSAGVHVPAKMDQGSWDWHLGQGHEKSSAYEMLGNTHLADRLRGHLLMVFGNLDENATLDHSMAMIQALIDAGKRFDVQVWPDANHYHRDNYTRMVTWDYFVKHLLAQEPPVDFNPHTSPLTYTQSAQAVN